MIGAILCLAPFVCFSAQYEAFREYPFTQIALSNYDGYYTPTVTKKDVVWLSETITIDSPLMSNGGNIILMANTVRINAPIDSRVYFEFSETYWRGAVSGNERQQGYVLEWPNILAAFDRLYFWTENYDTATKTYTFSAPAGKTLLERYNNATLKKQRRAPQLPSGMIQALPFPSYPTQSEDAPVVPRDISRSGDIVIIARTLEFCDLCLASFDPVPIPDGDPSDVIYRAMLNAAGLKGGRGGAGANFVPCLPRGSCADTERGGLSGLPSAGGDAGNVSIFMVGESNIESQRQLIQAVTNVRGGKPPQDFRLRTGTLRTVDASRARGAPAFNAEGPAVASALGADGAFSLARGLSFNAALSAAVAAITSHSLNAFDAKQLASDANAAGKRINVSPRRQFDQYLLAHLRSLQSSLLTAVPASLQVQPPPDTPPAANDLFDNLDCTERDLVSFTDSELEYVRKICGFKALRPTTLSNYLITVGGIYSHIPGDLNQQLTYQSLATDLASINENLTDAIVELQNIDTLLLRQQITQQRDRLLGRVNALQAAIEKLKTELNKDPTLQDMVDSVSRITGALSSVGVALLQDSYIQAGKEVGRAYNEWQQFEGLFAGSSSSGLQRLHSELDDARRSLRMFNFEVQATEAQLVAAQSKILKRSIEAQTRVDDRADLIAFLFDDLLRAALQAYIQQPAADQATLVSSLRAIRVIVNDFPDVTIPFSIPPLQNFCSVSAPVPFPPKSPRDKRPFTCVRLTARGSTHVLHAAKQFSHLPLVVVREGTGTFSVSLGRLGYDQLVLEDLTSFRAHGAARASDAADHRNEASASSVTIPMRRPPSSWGDSLDGDQ
ncbi:hypothetical protein [Variovorax sp. JS1663]|uniref:hypothetical protein n=1 Tax=Variovorax sp. JS1663 TaxID=1851577 RepID=UPI001180D0FB|nr:hypothetical protein [Variovorax sp. JS1663]